MTPKQVEHTPLEPAGVCIIMKGGERRYVLNDDLRRIVNCHEELLEALSKISRAEVGMPESIRAIAEKAIAKAEATK